MLSAFYVCCILQTRFFSWKQTIWTPWSDCSRYILFAALKLPKHISRWENRWWHKKLNIIFKQAKYDHLPGGGGTLFASSCVGSGSSSKYIHKIFIPPKKFIFLKTPKILKFKIFKPPPPPPPPPKKWLEPMYVWKYREPPLGNEISHLIFALKRTFVCFHNVI